MGTSRPRDGRGRRPTYVPHTQQKRKNHGVENGSSFPPATRKSRVVLRNVVPDGFSPFERINAKRVPSPSRRPPVARIPHFPN